VLGSIEDFDPAELGLGGRRPGLGHGPVPPERAT
jgi:hypothetical protein